MGKGRLRKLSNLGQVHSAAGIQTWGDQTPELSSKENGDQLTGLILCLMEQNWFPEAKRLAHCHMAG